MIRLTTAVDEAQAPIEFSGGGRCERSAEPSLPFPPHIPRMDGWMDGILLNRSPRPLESESGR